MNIWYFAGFCHYIDAVEKGVRYWRTRWTSCALCLLSRPCYTCIVHLLISHAL